MFSSAPNLVSPDPTRIISRAGDSAQETNRFAISRCKLSVSCTPFLEKSSQIDIGQNLRNATLPEGAMSHAKIISDSAHETVCRTATSLGQVGAGVREPDCSYRGTDALLAPREPAGLAARAVARHLSAGRLMAALRVLDGVA